MPYTAEQAKAVVSVMQILCETIREAGPQGVPAGTIYAALMTQGCTLNQYNRIESILVASGKVTRNNFLLKWKE